MLEIDPCQGFNTLMDMSYLVLIKKIWVVYVVLDWYWYEMHSTLAEFYEIFSTRFLILDMFSVSSAQVFLFLISLFMTHCHWLFHRDR